MAQLPWVKIFGTSLDMLLLLTEESAGRVIHAVARYSKERELPYGLDNAESIVFDRIRENVDDSAESYAVVCRRNKKNRNKAVLTKEHNQMLTTGDQRLTTGDQRLTTGDQRLTTGENIEVEVEEEIEEEIEDIKEKYKKENANGSFRGAVERGGTVPEAYNDRKNILGGEDSFSKFWDAYPKRVGKQEARKAFDKAIKATDIETILKAIEAQKQTPQWKKSNGQYIPNPATWLNQCRWEDETGGQDSEKPQRDFLKEHNIGIQL